MIYLNVKQKAECIKMIDASRTSGIRKLIANRIKED